MWDQGGVMKNLIKILIVNAILAVFASIGLANTASATDWSGAYLGIHGGYDWGTAKNNFAINGGGFPTNAFAPEATGGEFSQNINGGEYGGQLGFNIQRNNVVYGLEASIEGDSLKHTSTNVFPTVPPTVSYETKVNWLVAITPRLGYVKNDWLFFVKAGLAAGEVQSSLSSTAATLSFSRKTDQIGWTAGLGLNYALNRFAMNKWIVGLEYNYFDLGTKTYGGMVNGGQTQLLPTLYPVQYTVHPTFSSVQASLSYKF